MMSRTVWHRAMAAGARGGAPIFPVQNTVPTRYPPIATWGLIAANCAVFLFQISLSPRDLDLFLDPLCPDPGKYFQSAAYGGQPLTLGDYLPFATNMFLHGGWLHLILNMWTVWMFGPPVEDRLGHTRYLLFYLACGLAASRRRTCRKRRVRAPAPSAETRVFSGTAPR
jgi:membrane associated rhomboid family serine protease